MMDSLAVRRRLQRTESSTLEEKQALQSHSVGSFQEFQGTLWTKSVLYSFFLWCCSTHRRSGFHSHPHRLFAVTWAECISRMMEPVTCWHVASVVKPFHWDTSLTFIQHKQGGCGTARARPQSTLLPLRPIRRSDSAKEHRWRRVTWSSGVWTEGDWRKSQVWGWRPTEPVEF